jgi:hypothetical protein
MEAAAQEPIVIPPEQQEFDNYLTNVLMINNEALRVAIRNQGLLTFDDLIGMEEDDIKSITSNIRKPGGTLPRPTRQNPNATIPNPGLSVGHVITRRLEIVRYYVNHCARIQRLPVNVNEMTLNRLSNVHQHFKNEKDGSDVELPGKIVKIDDVRTNIEDLDSYLNNALGETYLPLAYLVREDIALPMFDEGFGMPSYHEEMIRRGDHQGAAYQRDNVALWNVISHMTHGGFAWNWVSSYERSRNGRGAYTALKAHYLGESYQARIRSSADAILQKTFYDGTRTFTFESYITMLQKAFTDLEATGEAVAEERKVRVLMRGITASNMQSAIQTVNANRHLKSDYEAAVNYLSETNDTQKSMASAKRNVSAISKTSSQKKGKANDSTNKKKRLSTGFMKHNDWWKLTDAQRNEIRQKRQANSSNNSNSNSNQRIQTVVTGVATDVSPTEATTVTSNTSTITNNSQSVGAVMTRRNRGGNN